LLGTCAQILTHLDDTSAYFPPSEIIEIALSLGERIF